MAVRYPKINYVEEVMREGMQIEDANIPVEAKADLLNALSETGLKNIVVGSFVSPKYTPQMAKMDEIMAGLTPKAGVKYSDTALNEKGIERAKQCTPPVSPKAKKAAAPARMSSRTRPSPSGATCLTCVPGSRSPGRWLLARRQVSGRCRRSSATRN